MAHPGFDILATCIEQTAYNLRQVFPVIDPRLSTADASASRTKCTGYHRCARGHIVE